MTVVIGVDPHKSAHTAAALNAGTNKTLEMIPIDAALPEYRRVLVWAKRFPERRWVVQNAWSLGRQLAQWLIAHGEMVTDVPSTATARVRELSRGGRRKNKTISTRLRLPVWRRYLAMRCPSRPRGRAPCCGCLTSGARI
ncbi:hypothetical protein [Nocardia vinacea]|uniref:hypothetical protein n=1 Tax=Nocardia vinacea TaxID=96468 RepID=UPI0012F677B7|nr:hypothetical protein [Nocardia vinacea]